MKTFKEKRNISLPRATFQKVVGAMTAVEEAREHIEDFLLLSNKKISTELQRARLDHAKGKVGSWTVLKQRYGISSHSHSNI